jgi:hypothetical protein
MLFSKKRSSRATISKKVITFRYQLILRYFANNFQRRADNELQQPDSSKRTKKSSFQDDEEEIGDFIVVDTGKFDDHEEAKQGFTIDEDNDTFPTYRTSNTPEIVLEDKEFGVKTRPHISKVDSDTAQQARDALLVLESVSTETAEYKRSRAQTIEISENHLPSGSKNSPVLVSPLTLKEEETSQSRATSPGPTTANLVASISSPLALVVEQSTQPPQVPEEMRADSNSPYPSISLPLASPAQSPVNTAFTQLPLNSSHTPSVTQQVEPVPVQELASEKISNAPQGVLVMKGDQCPSKFVVSGIALDSETDQQVRTKIDPKARNSVSWIETVTEARTNVLPEIPGSRVSGLHPCDNHGSGISEGLGDAPESPRQALAAITDATDASATLTFCSDALQLPQQSRRNCESEASDVHQASTDVQEQLVPDQQRQTSKSFHENETMVPGDTASKRLPLPIQYPKISPQASALVGPNPLRSSADKIVAAWWTTKLSCLDISPSANSRAIPLAVGLRLPMASPSSTLPSLRFTIDNRAESTLTTVEVQRLVQIFVRDAIAIIPREQSTQPKSYPAGIIMWQSLQKFYKWYAKEEKKEKGESSVTTVLKFELLDVHWQPEKVFLLPRAGNLDGFRALKQCIWDLFWVASNLNGASTTFRILVTRAPEKVNEADFHRLTAGKFSAPNQLPGVLSTPTSSHFASETPAEIGNFQGQEPETAQHHHQLPVVHPPPLTINSPPLVTLDVEGAQTPRVLRDFFQNNRSPDNTGPPSMHSSPTRPETNGSSILRTDLPLPSLLRPEKPVTVTSQPKTVTPPPSTPALNSNLDAQYHLSPPYHFETNTNSSSSSQTHDFALPSSQATSAIQLPSLRPSPLTMETSKAETPQTNLVSSSNYTANTARPLFAMPPQKVVTAFRTLLPSIQSNRVTNTAKPVPDFEVTQNPPPPTTDKDKDILTEIVPPIPQTSRTPRDKMMLRDKALQMVIQNKLLCKIRYSNTAIDCWTTRCGTRRRRNNRRKETNLPRNQGCHR